MGCEQWAVSSGQPERLQDSSRWSQRSKDHRKRETNGRTLKGCKMKTSLSRVEIKPSERSVTAPLQGAKIFYPRFIRWSAPRCDRRLLSLNPAG